MPPAKMIIDGDKYIYKVPTTSTCIGIWENKIINCVYVTTTKTVDNVKSVIDVFNLNGKLLTSFRLEERIYFSHLDKNGNIYGVLRSEEIGEKIVKYRIIKLKDV